MLVDTEIKGRKVKTAVHAGRDGYLWVLERKSDKLNFLNAQAYVYNNAFKSVDSVTGRPVYDPEHTPNMGKAVSFCPSLWGGKDWPPEAYNPKTGLVYIPANNNLCAELPAGEKVNYKSGDLFIGYSIEGVLGSLRWRDSDPNGPRTIGELQAWDIKTGKQAWVQKFPVPQWAPLLTTGGNLVFSGGTNDRMFRAFDAKNGNLLWETPTPSGITGVPTSFEVDGQQYIAVQSGWGVDAQRMQNNIDRLTGHVTVIPQGGTVMVYKLGK
jgi:alcohol dehydrogenase (cytochrome c)